MNGGSSLRRGGGAVAEHRCAHWPRWRCDTRNRCAPTGGGVGAVRAGLGRIDRGPRRRSKRDDRSAVVATTRTFDTQPFDTQTFDTQAFDTRRSARADQAGGGSAQVVPTVWLPSITNSPPVTNDDESETRNSTSSATSDEAGVRVGSGPGARRRRDRRRAAPSA